MGAVVWTLEAALMAWTSIMMIVGPVLRLACLTIAGPQALVVGMTHFLAALAVPGMISPNTGYFPILRYCRDFSRHAFTKVDGLPHTHGREFGIGLSWPNLAAQNNNEPPSTFILHLVCR